MVIESASHVIWWSFSTEAQFCKQVLGWVCENSVMSPSLYSGWEFPFHFVGQRKLKKSTKRCSDAAPDKPEFYWKETGIIPAHKTKTVPPLDARTWVSPLRWAESRGPRRAAQPAAAARPAPPARRPVLQRGECTPALHVLIGGRRWHRRAQLPKTSLTGLETEAQHPQY